MRKNLLPTLVLIAIVSLITFLVFKPALQNPNSYLFSHGGDAVKSYYNFSYHLKYGEGFKHAGINYPYGEHLQFINSHPFHTAILKQVKKIWPIEDYGVAIINLSMMFSFLLAAPFLFLILRRYKLPTWYSVIVAIIILFLSPQVDRIKGHFEMVYLFFIPMFWYFLIKFRDGDRNWLWGTLLVLTGSIGGFTSAYFATFYAILLFGVFFSDIWFNRKDLKSYIQPGLILLGMAIIPLIMVKGLSSITDWANDRPFNPWGFYIFHANPYSIFLPNKSILKELLSHTVDMSYQWEGRAYVGLTGTLMAIAIAIGLVVKLFKFQSVKNIFPDKSLNTYLFAGSLILLFSMCFPFKYGFGFLLELLPPVKQFRALGRFSWIFYYIFTVYTAYLIYQIFQKLKEKGLEIIAFSFVFIALGLWTIDAGYNMKKGFSGIFLENNKLESDHEPYSQMLKKANIEVDDFQAILFLPFANTSGDKLLFEEGLKHAFPEAMKCSYHTGLPLIQSFSPRLPFSNALSCIQMLADSSIRKTRLDDMTNAPLLVVITNEKLTKEELWIKNNSETLLKYGNVTLAKLDLENYHNSYINWCSHVDTIISKFNTDAQISSDIELERIYTMNFDDRTSEFTFHGSSGLFHRKGWIEIFNENFYKMGMSGDYELSFWMYFDSRMYDMPQPKLHLYKSSGEFVKTIRLNNRHIHNIYGNWVRMNQNFKIDKNVIYKLEVGGEYITLDDLMLKPKGANVLVQYEQGKKMFNNFPFEK